MRDPVVLNSLMYGAPAVLIIILLASIWRKTPDTKDTSEAGSPGHEPSMSTWCRSWMANGSGSKP